MIATSAGCLNFNVKIESLIGISLAYEGANVEFLICDHPLEVCLGVTSNSFNENENFLKTKNKDHYEYCFNNGYSGLNKTGLNINIFSKFLNLKEVKKDFIKIKKKININSIEKLKYKNFNLGENAKSGALRYLGKVNLKKKIKKF